MRPPLGMGRMKEALHIDVRLTIIEKKGKDLMEWIELSGADRVKKKKKKVTRQNPDQWLRQRDNHLVGHCAESGGLDLTNFSHTMNRTGQCWSIQEVMQLHWPVGAELRLPSLAHVITAGWHKAGATEQRQLNCPSIILKTQRTKQPYNEITLWILCAI